MTLLLIICTWSFVVILVAALCAAARRGDLQREAASARSGSQAASQPIAISAHAHGRMRGDTQLVEQLAGVSAGKG
jgi:hypothetical protein